MPSAAVLGVALGVSLLTTACRDSLGDGAASPVPSAQGSAQLVVTPATAGDSVVTVDVRVSGLETPGEMAGFGPKVVSMTAAVEYDTTRLRYIMDVSPSDGAMREMNAARGRVMIAAAHASGFPNDVFARVRFVHRGASSGASARAGAYSSLTLQISELHLSDATDVRERTTVLPLVVIK
ncbi:hypothetical protein [Gemmatimonas sp.]|uniref:hypothetical protein n=1 Tax=Gemmatimonas sp. TaxID=1962908 RepID=UPI00398343F7